MRKIPNTRLAILIPKVMWLQNNLPNIDPHQNLAYNYCINPPPTPFLSLRLVSGVGELDISSSPQADTSPHQSPEKPETEECPYLLLDVRDSEQYQKCHIITGKPFTFSVYLCLSLPLSLSSGHSYPVTMLSRSRNPYTKEMYYYVSFY